MEALQPLLFILIGTTTTLVLRGIKASTQHRLWQDSTNVGARPYIAWSSNWNADKVTGGIAFWVFLPAAAIAARSVTEFVLGFLLLGIIANLVVMNEKRKHKKFNSLKTGV